MLTKEPEMYRKEIDATKQNIDEIRKFIVGALVKRGYDEEKVFPIEVSFVELFENIIKHGYREKTGKVDVKIEFDGNKVKITVLDEGASFNLLEYKGPDTAEMIKKGISGYMGIRTIKSMCDEIEYKRIGDFNRNILIKKMG